MLAVRVISRNFHFDHEKYRVNRLAFKNIRDNTGDNPGISIIDEERIYSIGNTICEHIRKYYTKTAGGEPPIFWKFSSEILPSNHSLEHEETEMGDKWCHYNIKGVTDKQAKDLLFQYRDDLRNFSICENGDHRTLTRSDIDALPPAR